MPNPYIQVILTYLRHPFSTMKQMVFTMSMLLLFTINVIVNNSDSELFILPWSQLALSIALFYYWVTHVTEQFTDARASLTPYFLKVHGVVAIITAIVLVILLPGVSAMLSVRQPFGSVSITAFLFGVIIWAILCLGKISFFLIWFGWFSTSFEPIRNGIEKIVSGNEPVLAFTFLGVGAVLSITGIIRLFLLNEEKREYRLNINSTIDESRGWRGWFTRRKVVRMIYHARHATDSCWSRMQRWNCSNLSVGYALLGAAYFNLVFIFIYFVNNGTFIPGIRIFFATLFPVFSASVLFIKEKTRFMAQDIMMPVGRDVYLKQVGMSLATGLFIQWGVYVTVTLLLMLPSNLKLTPEFLIISISYSLMIQIWFFGLVIWASSFRSILMNFLVSIPASILVMVSFMNAFKPQMVIPWWPLILGAFFACHGLLLTWWGYRRWMVADFD